MKFADDTNPFESYFINDRVQKTSNTFISPLPTPFSAYTD
jgi:hypothetical protein